MFNVALRVTNGIFAVQDSSSLGGEAINGFFAVKCRSSLGSEAVNGFFAVKGCSSLGGGAVNGFFAVKARPSSPCNDWNSSGCVIQLANFSYSITPRMSGPGDTGPSANS
ncbi:MAG: hypothetical protein K0R75_2864 [Paenibacillaceae bacterium]|jgi:hypothetical protein|nr:hypothetical protein [Paenibacillaceae bacterium]